MRQREPSLAERMSTSAKAKQAQLERVRAKANTNDPNFAERQAARRAVNVARETRIAARKAAKLRAIEEQAAVEVERERALAAEAAARARTLEAEQAARELGDAERNSREVARMAAAKAARDTRYAARKARKK